MVYYVFFLFPYANWVTVMYVCIKLCVYNVIIVFSLFIRITNKALGIVTLLLGNFLKNMILKVLITKELVVIYPV